MTNRSKILAITALVFSFAAASYGQTDLSMRQALYLTGTKTTTLDLKNDQYVAAGGTIRLSTARAVSSADGLYEYNIGFVGFRTGNGSQPLSTYALLQVEGGAMAGNTLYFAANETVKQGVLPLKLKPGMNTVLFTIDPY